VISAVEGVQAHTLNLWESIRERGLPVLVFVNKIDRVGADLEQVVLDFEKDLSVRLFALNYGDIADPQSPRVVNFTDAQAHIDSPIIDKSLEHCRFRKGEAPNSAAKPSRLALWECKNGFRD